MPRFSDPLPPTIGGTPETGARPSTLDPLGPYFRQKRDPAAADKARREKYGNRTATPVADLTRDEIVANTAHAWAVPVNLVRRLVDLEAENLLLRADIHAIFSRLVALESK